jgi:hypothetical protein
MTETPSFLVGILVGVVLGTTTILSLSKYFALKDKNDKHSRISTKSETTKTSPRDELESTVTKETEFPPNWFSSTDNFNLETRAIFSKVDNPNIPLHPSQQCYMKSNQ